MKSIFKRDIYHKLGIAYCCFIQWNYGFKQWNYDFIYWNYIVSYDASREKEIKLVIVCNMFWAKYHSVKARSCLILIDYNNFHINVE